jgi:RHS repeat-associated protein
MFRTSPRTPYYTCTTGSQCGQINTITNALGHVTTFNSYNAHGQPLTMTDPNGVLTTLTYDARQRLKTRQVVTETTTYAYYATGLLQTITLPDSSTITYGYDAAHRLTDITDTLGNHIHYTLDAMGNRTAENTYDPNNTLHRTHTRVINALNEIHQDINAAGTASVTTTFGYDNNGNQTSVTAPLSRNTANQYDAFNRLSKITDPNAGITQFGYDANDNLISVTDPRGLTTGYSYNGFGDLSSQVSPDTGTTANTYDSGGNLKTATDARSATATYSYDALNRVNQVAYADQTINFTYDAGANGKGRLTGASDTNHSLSWTYDALGRATGKTQTVGGVTKTIGYTYTNADLTSLTTPAGRTVTYGYNSNHQVISVSVNGTTVLNSVGYDPFGALNGWTWGNNTATIRTFNTDGDISTITSSTSRGYSYDNARRITGITDNGNSALSWTYGYDALDRVSSASAATQSLGFTYDANGNRLAQSGSSSATFSVAASSNQLTGVTGALSRTYSYDAAGHTSGYGALSFTYNGAGRVVSVGNGSATTSYLYNALGQRVKKTTSASSTVFVYDESGHLIGEYDGATGVAIQEIVWLGDTPVATVRQEACGLSIFYIHTDHLNTPRRITRRSTSDVVWSWDSDPFGNTAANEDPNGLGAFSFNLRFPGQYYDAETGLNYNYHRDYDPAVGRYIESDPMDVRAHVAVAMHSLQSPSRMSSGRLGQDQGMPTVSYGANMADASLSGDLNSFAYVRGNPISLTDPKGLDALRPCPLVFSALIDVYWAPPILTTWFCIYDCSLICPTRRDELVSQVQTKLFPRWGCSRSISIFTH